MFGPKRLGLPPVVPEQFMSGFGFRCSATLQARAKKTSNSKSEPKCLTLKATDAAPLLFKSPSACAGGSGHHARMLSAGRVHQHQHHGAVGPPGELAAWIYFTLASFTARGVLDGGVNP